MLISRAKAKFSPALLPEALDNHITMAASRNVCGDFFEEATANLFGAQRLVTDCNMDICPDLKLTDAIYLESKSIGNNGSAIVYTHRRDKDMRFMCEHSVNLYYTFWRHAVPVNDFCFRRDLQDQLAKTAYRVIVIPAMVLHEELSHRKPRTLNTKTKTPMGKRLGYGTNGYGKGWSIPCKLLEQWARTVGNPSYFTAGLRVYDWNLRHFEVLYHQLVPFRHKELPHV